MKVQLLFFAQLRDIAGAASMSVEIEGDATVIDLIARVCAEQTQNIAFVNSLQDKSVMVSVNQHVVDRSKILNDGDEIGFLPPVSGG